MKKHSHLHTCDQITISSMINFSGNTLTCAGIMNPSKTLRLEHMKARNYHMHSNHMKCITSPNNASLLVLSVWVRQSSYKLPNIGSWLTTIRCKQAFQRTILLLWLILPVRRSPCGTISHPPLPIKLRNSIRKVVRTLWLQASKTDTTWTETRTIIILGMNS